MKELTNSLDDKRSNPTKSKTFAEIVRVARSRRDVVKGGLASAAAFLGGGLIKGQSDVVLPNRAGLTDFRPVTRNQAANRLIRVSADYRYQVIIPWGEPITPGGPAFTYPSNAEDQANQIGVGHDGLWYFPDRDARDAVNRRGLLAINHEFGTNGHVIGKGTPESLEDVRLSQNAHGVSIVGILRENGVWKVYDACSARRIHANTPTSFSGPAAGSPLLDTSNGNNPRGTINNCGCGPTPWGTYLTCEENIQGYFGASTGDNWVANPHQERIGFTSGGFGYGWHLFDKRFDLADDGYQNEENRFGWVVEIDPYDANHVPVKRTALGRFKHENAAIAIGKDRRVACYMGDDQVFEYVYKFVGDDDYIKYLNDGESPLDHGTLYVARFNEEFTGEWLALDADSEALSRFSSQAEVAVYTREAADLLNPTPMDRPEWLTVAPDGSVFCALTNNTDREEPNAANPEAPNNDGHIIRIYDGDMHVGTTFSWEIFQLASSKADTEEAYSDPDSIYCDPDGRLFIGTDGGQELNMDNQLLVADVVTGDVKRLLAGVPGCEITGTTMTPDRRTMFINVQHPGNGSLANTNFPASNGFENPGVPRDATVVIYRRNGGIVGS